MVGVVVATKATVRRMLDDGVHGRGLVYVDAHLLASATHTPGCVLWTRDRRLRTVAAEHGLAHRRDGP